MFNSLPAFLRDRSERSYFNFMKSLAGLTSEQSLLYAHSDWPTHRWGIGQNGSIAGIVTHVAAWKQMTLPLLSPDGRAISLQEFNRATLPALTEWSELTAWYQDIGAAWLAKLTELPDTEFEATRIWEGTTLKVSELTAEILEHDIQHASQIDYLRQRIRVENM